MKTKKKLAKLVLDPKRWLRGRLAWRKDDGFLEKNSYLLRERDGRMCCLGFECVRRGLSESTIAGAGLPSEVLSDRGSKAFLAEVPGGVDLETCIAGINDDKVFAITRSGDLARVRKLRPLFEKLGVRLVLGRAK